jgi:predicted dehydrogenase
MNIALIEVSHWHVPLYVEALTAIDGVSIAAVSDGDEAEAARVAVRCGCKPYGDYRTMVREIRPDFVFAFGKHRDMPAIARELIGERIPFSIEKPMGVDAREVEAIRVLAERSGLFVSVPLVLRYGAIGAALDELRKAVRFGAVTNAYFRFIAGPPSRYLRSGSPWMLDPAVSGGGSTINLGVHFIDFFLSLDEGLEATAVYAVLSRKKYEVGVEDFSTVMIKTSSDAVCTVETGYAYPSDPPHPRHIEYCITTTTGYLEIRDGFMAWADDDGNRIEKEIVTDNDRFYRPYVERTLSDFREKRRPPASVAEMARTMRIVDAAYRSGRDEGVVGL